MIRETSKLKTYGQYSKINDLPPKEVNIIEAYNIKNEKISEYSFTQLVYNIFDHSPSYGIMKTEFGFHKNNGRDGTFGSITNEEYKLEMAIDFTCDPKVLEPLIKGSTVEIIGTMERPFNAPPYLSIIRQEDIKLCENERILFANILCGFKKPAY